MITPADDFDCGVRIIGDRGQVRLHVREIVILRIPFGFDQGAEPNHRMSACETLANRQDVAQPLHLIDRGPLKLPLRVLGRHPRRRVVHIKRHDMRAVAIAHGEIQNLHAQQARPNEHIELGRRNPVERKCPSGL